jgi:hypothetical protein
MSPIEIERLQNKVLRTVGNFPRRTDTDKRLPKDRPHLSSERVDLSVAALARTSSCSKLQTRPFVREGATTQHRKSQGDRKISRGSQMGA